MERDSWFDVASYYVGFVPRRVLWAAEDALRWTICRIRGHRWTVSIAAAAGGCGPFTSACIPLDQSNTHCGRCGKRIDNAVTFTTKTVNQYRIW